MSKRANRSIKTQISSGLLSLVSIPLVMTVVTIIWMVVFSLGFTELTENYENQNATKDATIAHYLWSNDLLTTITQGTTFTSSLDHETCGLGTWINAVGQASDDPRIQEYINNLHESHVFIHTEATEVIELSKTNDSAAYDRYLNEFLPKVDIIISNIEGITDVYEQNAAERSEDFRQYINLFIITSILLLILALVLSYFTAKKTSNKIATPIIAVSNWSKEIARGDINVDFNEIDTKALPAENEVSVLLMAFKEMVDGIKANAHAISRISSGDLTTYVDIRSENDALGKNLYELVQSNDLLFSFIVNAADEVAKSAIEVNRASVVLSENSIEQSAAVEQLSATMDNIKELTDDNFSRVTSMSNEFGDMKGTVDSGVDKMQELVRAVEEIREASDKISTVIKSIESIAFQTNILALNASVEAARAGTAGKGFAVVADEVRELASKSAIAAEETKELIENTIAKTHIGEKMAQETSNTFHLITDSLSTTAGLIDEIRDASLRQDEQISDINTHIKDIANSATHNAANSEETSAAADIMMATAETLTSQLNSSFHLRERTDGKPYIPPEKQHDTAFIEEATKNYRKALQEGRVSDKALLPEHRH